jgi:hypothetical protein
MRPVPISNSHAYSPATLDDAAFAEPLEPVSETRLRAAVPKEPDEHLELLAAMADALEDILRSEMK